MDGNEMSTQKVSGNDWFELKKRFAASLFSTSMASAERSNNDWARHHWREPYYHWVGLSAKQQALRAQGEKFAQCTLCEHLMRYSTPKSQSAAWKHTATKHPEQHPQRVRLQSALFLVSFT